MGTTTPDNLFYPDPSYTAGWRQGFEDGQNSVQAAFTARAIKTFRPADSTARAALAANYTLEVGDEALQTDNGIKYRWSGSVWEAGFFRPPFARLVRNATTWNFPNNTDTQLISTYFNTEFSDQVTVTTGADTKFTILHAGLYEIFGVISFTVNSTGARILRANLNSATATTNVIMYRSGGGSAGGNETVEGSVVNALAVGDVVRFNAFQNSGGTLAILNASDQITGSSFGVRYLGGA